MKCETWVWGNEEAAKFDGHDIPEADALRIACAEFGWDGEGLEVERLWVVRDPAKDGIGDADEAFEPCEADAPGAVAVTLVK